MGHFIRHIAGSEPCTHRGGGKAAVCALLKASAVGRTARCSGLGWWTAWGGAPARGGAPAAWGEGEARGLNELE